MVTFEKAVDTLHNVIPNVLIYECGENDTFFFFGIQPERLWGTDDIPSGGSTHVVWKESGKYDMINFDLWSEEEFDKILMNDYPTRIDYSEMPISQAILSKEELAILAKLGELNGTIVGYDYCHKSKRVFPRYKIPANSRDIPTDGGIQYYDLKLQQWGWMDLLEYCQYTKLKTVRFDNYVAEDGVV